MGTPNLLPWEKEGPTPMAWEDEGVGTVQEKAGTAAFLSEAA